MGTSDLAILCIAVRLKFLLYYIHKK